MFADPVNLHDWDCDNWNLVATVNQPITPVTCTCTTTRTPRFNPQLPVGLSYEYTANGNFKTVRIVGTPSVPQQTKTYSIGFKEYVSQLRIGIIGNPTSLSYGFDSMTQYVGVPIEPVPARSDAYLGEFTINPALPEGVNIDATTGTITGQFNNTATSNQVYTVTGRNTMGTVQTTIKFVVRENTEMTTPGFIGCYWSGTTECRTPAFDYYYQNTAQFCQKEMKLDFTDTYGEGSGNTWPGLDERFRDYYTSYMYGYIQTVVDANYVFSLASDDASFLYIDSLETPVINRDGCRGSSTDTASVHLATGRHLFVVKFLEVNGAATLSLRYASPDVGLTQQILDSTNTKVGGRGPTFITYPLITGYANAELKVYTPERVSGDVEKWEVNPPLPSGMTLDQHRGEIRGRPTGVYTGYHTITATGSNGSGVASTQIQIIISDKPLSGFRGQYYKVFDDEMCMYTNLALTQMELKVVRLDAQLNWPQTTSGMWDGLPTNFDTYFFVEWEGYLYFSEIGTWNIRMKCDDSCRLFGIEETLLIDYWSCHSTWDAKETTIAVSSPGYYYYKIRYQQKDTKKGLVLEWRSPSGQYDIIPADKIFHLAPGMLSYEYEQAHYFQGVNIAENSPRLFSIESCNNYQIVPALPNGLSINVVTGTISGAPIAEQALMQYTVSCAAPSGIVSTTIRFDVFYELAPSGLSLYQNGSPIGANTVMLNPGAAMSQIYVNGDYNGVSFAISPALPSGLDFNTATGSISGTPYEPSEAKAYVITARNNGGIMTMSLTLGVRPCKGSGWTNDLYMIKMISGYGTVTIQDNGSTAQCSTGSYDSNGNAVLSNCYSTLNQNNVMMICMPPSATAKIELTCQENSGCLTQIYRSDNNRWPSRFTHTESHPAPYVDTWDFPSTLTPLTSVSLSLNETTVYMESPMISVTITPNGCFKEITVEPSLGVDFTMDLEDPKINMEINGVVKSVFTVTAKGDAGTASATLTVFFKECGDNGDRGILKCVMVTKVYGYEQSYTLKNQETGEVIASGSNFASNAEYTNTYCVPVGDYVANLYDSYGDGWSTGSFLNLYDQDNNLIQEFTIAPTYDRTATSYTGYFSVVSSSKRNIWKAMMNKEPKKGWNAIDFDDSAWPETTTSVFYQNWSQNTIYFRYAFEVTDAIKYPLVQYGIWYKDGIIIYLNGEEVYRRNMPSGTIRHNTMASSMYEGYYQRVGSAPGYLLKDGKNVVAVEIHKHASTSGEIQFAGYANALQGDCISRVSGGTITESSFFNQPTNSAAQAWDRNENTEWIENGSPAWTVYSYNFDRMEWVNRLGLVSSSNAERDPKEFHLYGSTDGVNWEELYGKKTNSLFTGRRQRQEFMMLNHLSAFSKYKFEMIDSVSGFNKLSMAVIDIMSCQLNYCVMDGGFPGVMSDETSVADCPEGFIGEMFRKCQLAALRPQWEEADLSHCRSTEPPKKTVYIDTVYYLTNTTVEMMQTGLADKMRIVIAEAAKVEMSKVEVWYLKDISENYVDLGISAVAFWVRITLEEKQASAVLKNVNQSVNTIVATIKSTMASDFPANFDLGFYKEPVLQQRKKVNAVSVVLIVIVVILVLIIAAIAAFYIWVRTKSKKNKNGAKQLRSGKVNAEHLSGNKSLRV